MKEYKVESLIYYTKLTLDSEHIVKKSKEERGVKEKENLRQEEEIRKKDSLLSSPSFHVNEEKRVSQGQRKGPDTKRHHESH